MLAAHSKKLEHSLTQSAASIRPASPTAGRAAVEQTEPFQHGVVLYSRGTKNTHLKDEKNTLYIIISLTDVCTNGFFRKLFILGYFLI